MHYFYPTFRCKEELIIFKMDQFFWETAPLGKDNSLLKVDVEVIIDLYSSVVDPDPYPYPESMVSLDPYPG
jgi:hypothetical protein